MVWLGLVIGLVFGLGFGEFCLRRQGRENLKSALRKDGQIKLLKANLGRFGVHIESGGYFDPDFQLSERQLQAIWDDMEIEGLQKSLADKVARLKRYY